MIECTESTIAGKTESKEAPEVAITTETFAGCNATVTVNTKGKLVFHHKEVSESDPVGTGSIEVVGGSVTVKLGGEECTYGGTVAGSGIMLNGGEPAFAEATFAETRLEKIGGGIFCASPAEWSAKYEIVKPKPLYVGTAP